MKIRCPFCKDYSPIETHFPCDSGPEIRTYTIDRISNNNNAITPTGLNLGPLVETVVGKKVSGVPTEHVFVLCLDTEYWTDNYYGEFNRLQSGKQSKSSNQSEQSTETAKSNENEFQGETRTQLGASISDLIEQIPKEHQAESNKKQSSSQVNNQRNFSNSSKTIRNSSSDRASAKNKRGSDKSQSQSSHSGSSNDADGEIHKDQLLERLRQTATAVDGFVERSDVYQRSNLSHGDVLKHFDSLEKALKAAGVDRQTEILEEIDYVAEEVNRLPSKRDMTEEGNISGQVLMDYFETWKEVHEAYLQYKDISEDDLPDKFLIGELRRLSGTRNHTDLVNPSDLGRSVFDRSTYVDQYGSWSAALETIEVNIEEEIIKILEKIDANTDGKIKPHHIKSERSLDVDLVKEVFDSFQKATDAVYGSPEDSDSSDTDTSDEDGVTGSDRDSKKIDDEQTKGEKSPEIAIDESAESDTSKREVATNRGSPRSNQPSERPPSEQDEEKHTVSSGEPSPEQETRLFWDRDVDPLSLSGDMDSAQNHRQEDQPATGNKLDTKIDQWKSQCIDLTRRNHLINFTETKSKSLPLVQRSCTDVAQLFNDTEEIQIRKNQPDTTSDAESPELNSPALLSSRSPDQTNKTLSSISRHHKQYLRERGVDTLYVALGQLCWYSVDYSDEIIQSPLFLAPVELEETVPNNPKSHNYRIKPQTEGFRINPALQQKLAGDHGIALPNESELSLESIDAALEAVHQTIQGFERWFIQDAVVLGIFDFSKYSIYSDLEENREKIKNNPIIRALNGDVESLKKKEGGIDTPTADELDKTMNPVDVYQVLDADSSQQEAIEAAKRGKSFVLQGPPGTGKSQTIANIIAEKLAAGETVLFVSEKQAALDVVKDRLDDVDIGRFCLEAHGQKATVSEVLEHLEQELQTTPIKPAEGRERKLQKLRDRRKTINEYENHLFYSPPEWNLYVYKAFGLVSKHNDAPYIPIGIENPLEFSEQAVMTAIEELETLAQFEDILQHDDGSPWRHTTLRDWSIETAQAMERSLQRQQEIIDELMEVAAGIEAEIGFEPTSLSELREMVLLLETLTQRPEIQWQEKFFEDEFYQSSGRLTELADLERERTELLSTLTEKYQRSFLKMEGAKLNGELAGYGLFKLLRPSYRSLRRRIVNHAESEYAPSHSELLEDTRKLGKLQRLEDRRVEYQQTIQQLGPLYRGEETDWERLLAAQNWIDSLVEYDDEVVGAVQHALLEDDITTATELSEQADNLLHRYDKAAQFFYSSMDIERLTIAGSQFEDASFKNLQDELNYLENQVPALQRRVQFESQLQSVQETLCEKYVGNFLDGDYPVESFVSGFKKRFYTKWLSAVYDETDLDSFSVERFERYLSDFRQLDQEQQELAKVEIQHKVLDQRPSLSLEHAAEADQVVVKREVKKQRQHKPLRELFDEAGSFITQLTPCFMMSPLSVAQYLKPGAIEFDTVVFDEASQVMPHDAVSSIIRSDQAIIAGDSKQLPPTSFFNANVETADDVRDDLDSILEETSAVLPEKRLRWHYRSRDSELIAFSNYQYYDSRLRTFPDNDPDTETGVFFEYVSDGVYDRGGSARNDTEAERVVDLIEAYAKQHSEKSLGVVAFSQNQQEAIRDVLEERCRTDQVLKEFVNRNDVLDEFFIKNLETVQGDERDRMLFSIGYGPDQTGKISMNFGPLNTGGGERRLNVAITRAREKVTIVSSIQPEDIDLTRTNSTGVEHLKKYLEYAKQGEVALARDQSVTNSHQFDSPFEEAVYEALTNQGFEVVSQVQSAGYSIDLAIKHPKRPGEFILGIECDGAAYHSSKTARDRDRTRQAILEDLGWTIHRIWSPDWVSNTERELQKIGQKVDSLLQDSSARGEHTQQPADVKSHKPEPVENPDEETAKYDELTVYQGPPTNSKPNCSYDEIPNEEINRSLKNIIQESGPIKKDTAFRLVVNQWGISRLGKHINRSLAGHAGSLQRKGEFVRHNSFLWPPQSELDFRVRTHDGDETRDIEEIPLEELAKAAYLVLSEGGRMTKEDVELEVARFYNYQRRGKRIRARLDNTIELLQDLNATEKTNGRFRANEAIDIDELLLNRVY